jgi:hypothetical protein
MFATALPELTIHHIPGRLLSLPFSLLTPRFSLLLSGIFIASLTACAAAFAGRFVWLVSVCNVLPYELFGRGPVCPRGYTGLYLVHAYE